MSESTKSRKELLKEVESLRAQVAELEKTVTHPQDSASLRESEAGYQELFDSLMDGIGFFDENEVFQFCNPACVRIFEEYSCEAMVGKSLLLYLPDDQTKLVRQETSQRRKGMSSAYELEIVTAKGNHRIISVTASPQFDEAGKFTGTSSALFDITERRKTEEALHESEERNRNLVESVQDVIYIISPEGVVTSLSPAFETITGWSASEWVGKSIGELMHPDDVPGALELFKALLEGATPSVHELRIRAKSGEYLNLEFQDTVIKREGKVVEMLGCARDVTDRKQAENLLFAQHELAMKIGVVAGLDETMRICLDAAIEGSGMDSGGIYIVDEDSSILRLVSSRGLSPEFLEVSSTYESGSPSFDLVMAGAPVYVKYEELIVIKDEVRNREGLCATAIVPIQYKGQVIACMNIASHSLNEIPAATRKTLETIAAQIGSFVARSQAEEALREKERFHRALLDDMLTFVAVLELNGDVVFVNNTPLKTGGLELQDVIGKKFYDAPWWTHNDEVRDTIIRDIERCSHGETLAHDIQIQIADGSLMWIEFSMHPIYDDHGNVQYLIPEGRDITERKQAEEALRESEEKLRAIFETAKDSIFMKDRYMRYVSINPAMEDLFGLQTTDILGKNDYELFGQEAADHIREMDLRVLNGETVEEEHTKSIREQEYTFHIIKVPIQNAAGEITGLCGVARDVTERKQTEEALKESEERLNLVLQGASLGSWDHNLKTGAVIRNRQWAEMLGYTLEEINSDAHTWIGLIHPDDLPAVERIGRAHEAGQIPFFRVEHRLKMNNGEWKWILNWGKIIERDSEGKPVRGLGIHLDITERKQAEKALKESEERATALLDAIPDLMFRLNRQGVYLDYRADKSDLHVQPPDIIIGKSNRDLLPPELADFLNQKIRLALDSGERQTFEYQMPIPARGQVDFEARLVKSGEDEVTAIVRDITERKQAEVDLLRLSRAIEQAAETIVITDTEGTIQYVNPAFGKSTGYSVEETIGQNPRILKSGKQDDAFYEKMWETLLRGEEWRGEIINKRKDGTLYTEDAIISPVFDSEGKVVNFVAAMSDITEIRRLQTLESRAERLEVAGRIAGQVAHDFNNLLAPLIAYPEFIREELPENHSILTYLEQMEKAASQIADINQQLLTLGRRGHYNQEPLELNETVHQVLKQMEAMPPTLVCETKLAEDLLRIMGGSAQIGRVLLNLISNARDAMQNIGQITIITENYYIDQAYGHYANVPRGEYVKLTITDTGSGIPPEVLPTIFEPFVTTKTTDKKRGSGLGLSVVDAVVKDHDGYIDVRSVVGEGTSFYLYFPVARQSIMTVTQAEIVGGTETVLVVDDDVVQRDVSVQLLKKLGYDADVVESGEKAIEFIKSNPRELLLLDMIMPPGIDGTETYRQALEINPDQRAIIVSGFAESDRVDEALRLGAGAYIRKPLTLRTIAEAVRRELDRVGASVGEE